VSEQTPRRLRAFVAQVDPTAGEDACWYWRGPVDKGGYGSFGAGTGAHRAAYELMVGPIPDGRVVDHLCHNVDPTCPGGRGCRHRLCVNPAHLDVVTRGENVLRSPHTMPHVNAAKTRCPAGHEYTPENTYVKRRASGSARRECRTCRTEKLRGWRERARASAALSAGAGR
jgi:hypothetical protein